MGLIDENVLRIIIDAAWSAAQTQSNQRIIELERQRDEAVRKCVELSAQFRALKFGSTEASGDQLSSPEIEGSAWGKYCARNMRDEEIDFAGHRWRVVTHLREGLWRIVRVDGGAVEDSVRFDWDGNVVE